MDSSLLDRKNYNVTTIDTFEVLSAYFIDILYNYLYKEAKQIKAEGRVISVTEGYKVTLNIFKKSLKTEKGYKHAINGIHSYFMNYTSYSSITFAKCIDRIVKEFIPLDYYTSLSNSNKSDILQLVITQAISKFTLKIYKSFLKLIIDSHDEKDNVKLLKDELIDIFLMEREGMYYRFVESQSGKVSSDTISSKISEKMHQEIKTLLIEKIQYKKTNEQLKQIIIKNNPIINNLKELNSKLTEELKKVNDEKNNMQLKINNLHTELYELSSKNNSLLNKNAELSKLLNTRNKKDKNSINKNNIIEPLNTLNDMDYSNPSDYIFTEPNINFNNNNPNDNFNSKNNSNNNDKGNSNNNDKGNDNNNDKGNDNFNNKGNSNDDDINIIDNDYMQEFNLPNTELGDALSMQDYL